MSSRVYTLKQEQARTYKYLEFWKKTVIVLLESED